MGKLSCKHTGGFILFSFEKWLSGPLYVGKRVSGPSVKLIEYPWPKPINSNDSIDCFFSSVQKLPPFCGPISF